MHLPVLMTNAFRTHDLHSLIFPPFPTPSLSHVEARAASLNITASRLELAKCAIDCSGGFYRDNTTGFCMPECGKFKLFDSTTILTSEIFLIIACSIGILSTGVIIIIFCLRFKSMWESHFCHILWIICVMQTLEQDTTSTSYSIGSG